MRHANAQASGGSKRGGTVLPTISGGSATWHIAIATAGPFANTNARIIRSVTSRAIGHVNIQSFRMARLLWRWGKAFVLRQLRALQAPMAFLKQISFRFPCPIVAAALGTDAVIRPVE